MKLAGNNKNFLLLKFIFLLLIFLKSTVSGAQPLLDQPNIEGSTLRPGESLEYNVRIKGVPAGTQTLQVNGKKMIDGTEVYHVESSSKANGFFNIFYIFDDQSESFINIKDFYPLRYRRKIRDGRYTGIITVNFDSANQVAIVAKDKKYTEIYAPEGTQDELSMIYLLRAKELEVGQSYEFPAIVGAKSLNVGVSVLRIEVLKTVLGTLKTIVVKTLPRDITVWFTNDSARIPVKIEASTKLGKLVSNLKSMN